jgi:hypothetical protein
VRGGNVRAAPPRALVIGVVGAEHVRHTPSQATEGLREGLNPAEGNHVFASTPNRSAEPTSLCLVVYDERSGRTVN